MFLRLFFLFLIIFSGCIALNETIKPIKAKDFTNSQFLCFESNCFSFEKAVTKKEQAKGLMFKKSMPLLHGMLFIFKKEKIPVFWMKNMEFSIDIIWLDKNLEVKDVSKNLKPCKTVNCPTYSPKQKVLYAFEVNAGTTNKLGIKPGSKVVFK